MSPHVHADEDVRQPEDKGELDRKLDELSGELRLMLPAVTVLLAFLLTVPFANGWSKVKTVGTEAYFVAFISTVLAVVLLVGETAFHHIGGRPYNKARLIRVVRRNVRLALALLLIALVSITLVLTGVVYSDAASYGAATGVAAVAVVVWFVVPVWRRKGGPGDSPEDLEH
jgi:membrane protein YdbS with pleckstrin-like domain